MKILNLCSNTLSSVKVSVLTNWSNSCPATIFGFCVVYRLTIWAWWKWQNCTGIGENSSGKPLNPSQVTERMVYPRERRNSFPSWYQMIFSSSMNLHQRFSLFSWSRNTNTPQSLVSFIPKYVASTTRCTARGVCIFSCIGSELNIFWSWVLVYENMSDSSLNVCFEKTNSFQRYPYSFSRLKSFNLNRVWQFLHLYLWPWSPLPFLTVLNDWQWGHFVRFFWLHIR